MRRSGLVAVLLALGAWLPSCEVAEPGSGSNTNWLKGCDDDTGCSNGLSCLCGVCTMPCDGTCPDLPDAICAPQGSAALAAQCSSAPPAVEGVCMPACAGDAPCGAGQLCSDGMCLQLASSDESGSDCVAGAKLELDAGGVELEARYGTLFGDALYLPVSYQEQPADWVEPMQPTPIVARVTGAAGEPVEGCAVRFVPHRDGGSAFANRQSTDAAGEVTAYWVAGAQRDQLLSAAIVDQRGQVASADIAGTAYANDEGPRADDPAAMSVARPATLRLGYDLPEAARLMRVRLLPETFPHHAFYAALNIDGFFAGLQNTSDVDLENGDVPEQDRVLIASVWNVPEGDGQLLWAVAGASCGPHQQDLGGIRCLLPNAWQPGTEYLLTLERTTLALGEFVADYQALGYLTEPCASAAGCTDYTLYFAAADDPDAMQRVVAYRYQTGRVATRFGSFVQPYWELDGQTSCLSTPRYRASFMPYVMLDAGFERVPSASYGATYETWHNEVCANYDAATARAGFELITGGPEVLGRPDLPGEAARELTLP